MHLGAGYDSGKTRALLTTLDYDWQISTKGESLQTGARWVVERTNAFIALANATMIIRRLVREDWTIYRWDTRPEQKP